MARCGQIIDALLVQAPVRRNERDEAEAVKESAMLITRKAHKRAQKDVDAKWTKNHFGYKHHACIGKRHQFVREVILIDAAVLTVPFLKKSSN